MLTAQVSTFDICVVAGETKLNMDEISWCDVSSSSTCRQFSVCSIAIYHQVAAEHHFCCMLCY